MPASATPSLSYVSALAIAFSDCDRSRFSVMKFLRRAATRCPLGFCLPRFDTSVATWGLRRMSPFTDVFFFAASVSSRFHSATGSRTERTAVGSPGGRPRRTTAPTRDDGISHRDQSAMPSDGS